MVAAGVGVAAGTMGTWFEMSHGVICIPVMTLPPLQLSQQVAAGTTVFGVAAREALAAALYSLDPSVDLSTRESMEDIVDVNALLCLSAAGTATAFGATAIASRMPVRYMKKMNGLFCCGLASFLHWRETQVVDSRAVIDTEDNPELLERRAESYKNPSSSSSSSTSEPTLLEQAASVNLREEWARLTLLGAASGGVLGFFGIGTAWVLAPMMRHTAPSGWTSSEQQEPFCVDARTRRTACLSMLLPSIVSAYRHLHLGHVPHVGAVALPLAIGAIGGSIIGGVCMEDVPADTELKSALAALMFAYGIWTLMKP